MRSLHVDGKIIPYEIKNTTIIFVVPGNKKRYVRVEDILDLSTYEVEKMHNKHSLHITPSDIRKYVIDNGIDMLFS